MSEGRWWFERIGPMGGSPGVSRIMSGVIEQPDLLVREAIQNSVDEAVAPNGRTTGPRVVFRFANLIDRAKSEFTSAASLDDFEARRMVLRGLPEGNCLSFLRDHRHPLPSSS